MPAPVNGADVGLGVAVNLSFNSDEFTIGGGLGAGFKIGYLNTNIKESVSLTDVEAKIISKATDVWTESWIVSNQKQIINEQGNITGFSANITTKNTKGELINTGISVYSSATTNDKGETVSTGVWSSKAYQSASTKAEKEE